MSGGMVTMFFSFHTSKTNICVPICPMEVCAAHGAFRCGVYKRNEMKHIDKHEKSNWPELKIEWTRLPAITVSLKLYLAAVFGKSFNLRPLSLSSPLKFASSNTFGIKPAIVGCLSLLFGYFGLSLLLMLLLLLLPVMTVLLGDVVALFTLQRFFEHLTKNVGT